MRSVATTISRASYASSWARGSASHCSSIRSRHSSMPPARSARRWSSSTPAYCEAEGEARERELRRIVKAAAHAEALGLECHAGHGLSYETVGAVAAIPTIVELNIGHFLIGEAIFSGLDSAIKRMRAAMDKARADAQGAKSA